MITLLLVSLLLSFPVSRGKARAIRVHPVRFLAEHTNAVLRKKCRPTYASLAGSRQLWIRRHRLAHRAKRGTCAPRYPWTSSWFRDAMCIHHYEGSFTADTGNGYGGGYQFLVSTFNRAAGRGVPFVSSTGQIAGLSPFVQTLAAYRIWSQDGGSWREWGTAGKCGLV